MKKRNTKRVDDRALEAFNEAFPFHKWSTDNMFNFFIVDRSKLCKVCDKWIKKSEQDKHLRSHVSQWLNLVDKRREEAKQKRIKALEEWRKRQKDGS